jgi:hypothetical protein
LVLHAWQLADAATAGGQLSFVHHHIRKPLRADAKPRSTALADQGITLVAQRAFPERTPQHLQ